MKTALIVNPQSADGSTGRDWPRLFDQIRVHLPDAEAFFTAGKGDATRATREALGAGFARVVAVGGDGTNNEVVNGFFDPAGRPLAPQAVFGFLPRGTGCDFARFLGIPRQVGEAARRLAAAEPWPIDLGLLECVGPDGSPVRKLFLNIADFGIGGMVSARVNKSSKRFGGFISFLWHTLISLWLYENAPMEVTLDDGSVRAGPYRSVVTANGRFFGGGMNIAPGAVLDDGVLEYLLIPDVSALEAVLWTPRLYSRRGVVGHPKIESKRVARLTARNTDPARDVWIEMDGENPGRLPVTISVLPRVLRLQAPRPGPA